MIMATDEVAVHVLKGPAPTSRRAVYKRQLTHKFQSNDASWQATVSALQSFDCTRKLAQEQCHWESAMLALAVIGILCVSVESELLGVEMAQFTEEKIEENPGGPDSLAYSPVFITLKGMLLGTSGLLFLALIMRYRIVWKIKVVTYRLPKAGTFLSAYSGLRRFEQGFEL
ncbi:hypothetical protein PHYBOEH_007152 [Phytophthora boehmeriae]|uniref:Uncharacterized protein n=1 Tax=Phytophthora boehmeriae TaxID=109152 RepID=A0A8T1WDG7_9STRA|nr:hypothetical protein PHYBOEH_007152 [Phytophthora boehmeriae]